MCRAVCATEYKRPGHDGSNRMSASRNSVVQSFVLYPSPCPGVPTATQPEILQATIDRVPCNEDALRGRP